MLAIYIHVINGRPIADSATKYWTSFDLALREFVAGRMDIAGVDRVARAVLDSPKLSYIIPRFAECPSQENAFQWQMQTIFVKEAAEVTQKLNKHCVIEGQKPR